MKPTPEGMETHISVTCLLTDTIQCEIFFFIRVGLPISVGIVLPFSIEVVVGQARGVRLAEAGS
jgi:hypothetical protein